MRYHFWQFLINQEGQPINNAEISIYSAGTTTPITVYTGEITSDIVSVSPQISTNNNGYFEFWVGDEEETYGYPREMKIKISWNRPGISSGFVDNIDVFPSMVGVNENDPDSTYKNKLISNALAYKFNTHSEHDVIEDGFPVHGLMMVDTTSTENVFNRVISNRLGNNWESHRNYVFESLSELPLENSPHDLQPVQLNSSDSKFNKLMSNEVLFNINAGLQEITSSIYTETIPSSAWSYDSGSGNYTYNVIHNLFEDFPLVMCWDELNRKIYTPTEIISIDELSLTLSDSVTGRDTVVKVTRI